VADPGQRPTAEPGWQQAEHLLGAGLEVFRHVDDVAGARLGLARDAGEARLAQLQLSDADHVLHAHAHGEVAAELADEGTVGAGLADEAGDAGEIAQA
jgi:hypothetical protein